MVSFDTYVHNNIIDLTRRATVLEGYVFSRLDTQTLLNTGKLHGVDVLQTREVVNAHRAWEWVLGSHNLASFSYEELHEVVSDGVTSRPQLEGYFRPETVPIVITGTSYVPPLTSREQSLIEFSKKLGTLLQLRETSTSEKLLEDTLNFHIYLMKRQFFHDGNKRTAYFFTNYLLKVFDLKVILHLPSTKTSDTFFSKLKDYYGGKDDGSHFVSYLRRYYVEDISRLIYKYQRAYNVSREEAFRSPLFQYALYGIPPV